MFVKGGWLAALTVIKFYSKRGRFDGFTKYDLAIAIAVSTMTE